MRSAKRQTPAPNSIENRLRNFWLKKTCANAQTPRLIPVRSPNAVGFWYAAAGIAKSWMFITRMPSSAKPRSTSRLAIRAPVATGFAARSVKSGSR